MFHRVSMRLLMRYADNRAVSFDTPVESPSAVIVEQESRAVLALLTCRPNERPSIEIADRQDIVSAAFLSPTNYPSVGQHVPHAQLQNLGHAQEKFKHEIEDYKVSHVLLTCYEEQTVKLLLREALLWRVYS